MPQTGSVAFAGSGAAWSEPPPEALADAKTRMGFDLRHHWIKDWDVKTGLTDAHLLAIKHTLHRGWPVCAGLRWPKQEQWINDVLQLCPPDAVRDGHAVRARNGKDLCSRRGAGRQLPVLV